MSARGAQRERAVLHWLRDRGWMAFRAPASLGYADVIALRARTRPRLVEVKSTAGGPYERFGPEARERLRVAAEVAGADAFLAWWPPRGELRWIAAGEWPQAVLGARLDLPHLDPTPAIAADVNQGATEGR